MATVKRRSTVPYYAAAGTWVIYALLFPLYRVPHFLFVAVVSGVVFFIMNAVCGTVEVTVPDPPKKEESTGNPELDKMIKDGNLAISEMKRLNTSIKDEKTPPTSTGSRTLARRSSRRSNPTRRSCRRSASSWTTTCPRPLSS